MDTTPNTRTDSAADIKNYIDGFTPRNLDIAAWALASGSVRALTREAAPKSVAHARLLLSNLVGLLADPAVWDRTRVPDLAGLLTVATINAHVARASFGSKRTPKGRRDALTRLARVVGNVPEVVRRPKPRWAPDAFLAAGATTPGVPVSALVAARRSLPTPMSGDALKLVVELLTTRTSTEVASDLSQVLTTAPNQPGSTMTSRRTEPAGQARTKPAGKLSRRAQLARAKAAQAARTEAAELAARGIVIPDGTGVRDDIREHLARYSPHKPNRQTWAINRELVTGLVYAYGPTNPRHAQSLASYVLLYATWLSNRPGRDPQIPLTPEEVADPHPLESWLDECAWSDRSKATARSALRRIQRTINPAQAPVKLSYQGPVPPYPAQEADQLVQLVWHQSTIALTRDLCLIAGLGLGAGLDASDLRDLKRDSIKRDDTAAGAVLQVTVPGDGVRGRTVPIRSAYVPLVERGLALHEKTKPADSLLIGKVKDRNNVVGPIAGRSKTADSTPIELRMARLRNTWLVAMLCAPISLADLLPVAGLKSARVITELLPYCPPADQERIERVIALLRNPEPAP